VWNAIASLTVDEGVLWLPPGTPYAIGTDLFADWTYDFRRLERGQLRVTPPGAAFSVFLFDDHEGKLRGWYVNLEQPQRRTPHGFDYEDELLDIWVAKGHDPELLDEDELDEAVHRWFVSPERAAEIRAKAQRLLAEPPWPTGWEDWHPEPGWQVPDLPPGWETL
jgi:Protein of unknown function (DUF402)